MGKNIGVQICLKGHAMTVMLLPIIYLIVDLIIYDIEIW